MSNDLYPIPHIEVQVNPSDDPRFVNLVITEQTHTNGVDGVMEWMFTASNNYTIESLYCPDYDDEEHLLCVAGIEKPAVPSKPVRVPVSMVDGILFAIEEYNNHPNPYSLF